VGQILIRTVNDDAYNTLRTKSQSRGKSLEGVVRELIENEGTPDRSALLEEMRRIQPMTPSIAPSLSAADYREGLE
jgi:plasmid stability protein